MKTGSIFTATRGIFMKMKSIFKATWRIFMKKLSIFIKMEFLFKTKPLTFKYIFPVSEKTELTKTDFRGIVISFEKKGRKDDG